MEIMIGQLRELDSETAAFARQLGVRAVQLNTPSIDEERGYWTYEAVVGLKQHCEALGLELVALENTPPSFMRSIKLGTEDRDHQLELYCQTIASVGRAGVPFLGFNFMPSGVWRTDVAAEGRGGARVTAFDLSLVGAGNAARGPQGRSEDGEVAISEEELWANFAAFLEATLPAAEAAGVRLALHPDDPPVRSIGPTARVFYSVENLARAYEMAKGSRAFGFDLCLGTVSSMEGGPLAVYEAIERFAPLGAICYVHFRQVQGTVPAFRECFLGEGNYSPRAVVDQLRRYGFDGYLLDDHVPGVAGDTPWGHRARAHAIGFMQGLLCEPTAAEHDMVPAAVPSSK
jgi:mannonate dehydratase